jgi:formylglycine-generating enzyme required for sulfatase activity
MVRIPGGTFQMGSNDGDADEKPVHPVTLSSFKMGRTPVTVAMWKEYCRKQGKKMPPTPYWGWLDDHPIVNVSWNDAKAYCAWAGLSLPTEAQWEYADKGGQDVRYPWGDTFDPDKLVWYDNSGKQTAPVIRRDRVFVNRFGLVDMEGNVWQWCADRYGAYASASVSNPTGPRGGDKRILRGSSWGDYVVSATGNFRTAGRGRDTPDDPGEDSTGFRCVLAGSP